jgi:NADH-quinone oxidoreductase subunit J
VYVVIALALIGCSVLAVTTRKILRAATYLLFSLFATAALYFQLDYEFLGAVQIAVYAGGIVVLFVFSILLTSHPGDNSAKLASKKRFLGMIGALALLIVSGYSLINHALCDTQFLTATATGENPLIEEIGLKLLGTGHGEYLLPFEAFSVLLIACIIGGIVIARKR